MEFSANLKSYSEKLFTSETVSISEGRISDEGMGMIETANPYVVGPPVAGPIFYGRKDIFKFVQETLVASQQNAVVLYGQRRMGKTSILKELPHHLPGHVFHSIFFDLQGRADKLLNEVLYDLACEIASSLELRLPASNTFNAEKDYFRKTFLPQVYDQLEKRRLLLLLDEFDELSDEKSGLPSVSADTLFPYLRSLLDTEKKRLSFVFVVGRQLDQLPHWILRIFKDTQYKRIWLLDRSDAEALITDPVKGILTYEPEAIAEILKLTSGHPYFTQLMCYEVFNAKKKKGSRPVTAKDVHAVTLYALETGEPALVWIWEGLDQNSRLLLSAIAQVTVDGNKASAEMIQHTLSKNHVRLPALEWRDTLKILVEWGILERDDRDRVSFVVELVRLWVSRFQPLHGIRSDLTETLLSRFQMAEEAHRQGKYDEAIELYREVLKRNPNHPGAQLGLAMAFQEQGNLAEAVKSFEEAYWLDKLHSRDGLIETRLRLGEQLERQGECEEAGIHFKRVLELDPGNRDVLDKIKILYDQGVTALRTDQFDQAIVYFERVVRYKEDFQNVRALLKEARLKREKGVSFGLRVVAIRLSAVVATLLVLGSAGYIAYNNFLNLPTPSIIVATNHTTDTTPVDVLTDTPKPAIDVVTATPTLSPTPGPTATPSPTPSPTITPTPPDTATPIIIVVTATSTPTPRVTDTATPAPVPSPTASPTPTFKYDTPVLLSPDNGAAFHGQDAIIEIRWDPVPGELAEDEFYAVSFRYLQNGEIQYSGTDTKESSWQPQGSLYYLKADWPERRYDWDVAIVRVFTNANGKRVSIPLSPTSETRFFNWGD
jgi:tetratricopeptide (TPR) repeat protein